MPGAEQVDAIFELCRFLRGQRGELELSQVIGSTRGGLVGADGARLRYTCLPRTGRRFRIFGCIGHTADRTKLLPAPTALMASLLVRNALQAAELLAD